jgi:soluble lytic murein transglycosylase-like protein
MNIASDLAAVEQRITQITGSTIELPGLPQQGDQSASFADMVRAELATQNSQEAGGADMPGIASGAAVGAINAPSMVPPAQIDQLVQTNSAQWNVDPSLVKAIIANESGFNANATSNVGAQGLMQLMPGTAAGLGVTNAYDPAQNVWGGTRYIKGLLDRFHGDVRKAVAAYNAGPGAVEKYDGIPPYAETQNYVQNVLASYEKYRNNNTP